MTPENFAGNIANLFNVAAFDQHVLGNGISQA